MYKKVKTEKYYFQIVKQIQKLVIDGKLKKGDKLLPERLLAEEFGTSRSSIREAMSALEMLGIIIRKGNQGNFVNIDATNSSLDGELFKELLRNHKSHEIFEARFELEPIIASLAAKKRNDESLNNINNCLKKLNSIGQQLKNDQEKIEDYLEEDRKFHLEIARSTDNKVLFTVYSGLSNMLKEEDWKISKARALENEENIKMYETEHGEIFDAIRDGNSENAAILTRKHLEGIKGILY